MLYSFLEFFKGKLGGNKNVRKLKYDLVGAACRHAGICKNNVLSIQLRALLKSHSSTRRGDKDI